MSAHPSSDNRAEWERQRDENVPLRRLRRPTNGRNTMSEYRSTFTTPFDQYAEREGQAFTVLAVLDQPDDQHDPEVLPMYRIRFADGYETEAWPEEVLVTP